MQFNLRLPNRDFVPPGRWLVIVCLVAAGLVMPGATILAAERPVFVEEFGPQLSPGWSWVREDPQGWRLEDGALVMQVSTGGVWENHNNDRNVLLRAVPAEALPAFAIEVYLENAPENQYEYAGLILYYDDDNYAILNKERVGKQELILMTEKRGKPVFPFVEKAYQPQAVWLRAVVAGRKVTGQYRSDTKSPWQTLGQCELPSATNLKVGLHTGYAAKSAQHKARFRHFKILAVSP